MSGASGTLDKVDFDATFDPTTGEPLDGFICDHCGCQRWQHHDGGVEYGLICPGEMVDASERAP